MKTTRVCPKCERLRAPAMFKSVDPEDLWCKSCRKVHHNTMLPPAAADGPIISAPTEMNLGDRRVVVVQRIGGVVRITSACRVKRSETDSLRIGGTVLLPIENLREICREVMCAATDVD